MLQEDHWCPGAMLAYGLVPFPAERPASAANAYDRFDHGKYLGLLSAPAATAPYQPDVILIYCDTNQLRSMLLTLPDEERSGVKSNFFPFSCAYSVTSPIIRNEYWVNLPDPGEYVRALTPAGTMILSIPGGRFGEFMKGVKQFFKESRYANEQMMMQPDFPQPDFYKQAFKNWGLPQGD